jgi:2,3-bisphosphoglycerate-dependent phosphoglycerate mutase
LYLIRHADADWSLDETRALSKLGQSQAVEVADLLAAEEIFAIYSSPSLRAVQTVAPLASQTGLDIQQDPRLSERLLSPHRIENFEGAVHATWTDFGFAHPGGETNGAAQQRAVSFYEEVIDKPHGGPVVVSTHGNLLVLLLNYLDAAIGYEFWQGLRIPDVYRVEIGKTPHIERLLLPTV